MDIYNLIPPRDLVQIARLMVAQEDRAVNQNRLLRWFPSVEVNGLDWEMDTAITRDFTETIPFRALSTEAPIGKRWGTTRKSGSLPPFAKKYLITEYERIKERSLNASAPGLADMLEMSVVGSIQQGVRAAMRTMELMASYNIFDGAIDLSSDDEQNGVQLQVDWGRNPSNASTVANPWSDPHGSTPDDDEVAVLEYMQDEHDLAPEDMVAVMNRNTYAQYRRSEQVLARHPSLRPQDQVSDRDLALIRADIGLPPIMVMHARVRDLSGNLRRTVPDSKVAYLPASSPLGALQWGVPAMADEPEISLEYQERPGVIAYLMRELDPLKVWTVVDGIGLPTMLDPDASYILNTELS